MGKLLFIQQVCDTVLRKPPTHLNIRLPCVVVLRGLDLQILYTPYSADFHLDFGVGIDSGSDAGSKKLSRHTLSGQSVMHLDHGYRHDTIGCLPAVTAPASCRYLSRVS